MLKMRATEALVLMALALRFQAPLAEISSGLFHRVLVSKATLLIGQRVEVLPSGPAPRTRLSKSVHCYMLAWCDLWWCDAASGECYVSNMIVMPDYVELNTADALACYTRRRRDFVTGSSITSTPEAGGRVSSNLVDGIFVMSDLDFCYNTAYDTDFPWLLIDMLAPKSFRFVMFLVQPKGNAFIVAMVENLEIRVGMTAASGNFTSYSPFGWFVGPATSLGQEVVIEVPAPVTARYVSIQKMQAVTSFQICHVEVY